MLGSFLGCTEGTVSEPIVIEGTVERLTITDEGDGIRFEYVNFPNEPSELAVDYDYRNEEHRKGSSNEMEDFFSAMSQVFSHHVHSSLEQREDQLGHFASHVFEDLSHTEPTSFKEMQYCCRLCGKRESRTSFSVACGS